LAWAAGLRLEHSAADLWNAFVQAQATAQMPGAIEIQMDYFTRAVEAILTTAPDWGSIGLKLGPALHELQLLGRCVGFAPAQRRFAWRPSTRLQFQSLPRRPCRWPACWVWV